MVNRLLTGALEAHFITEDQHSHEWICFQWPPATSSTPPPPMPQGTETASVPLSLTEESIIPTKRLPKNFHFSSQSKTQVFEPFPKAAMKVEAGQIQTQKQKPRQQVHFSRHLEGLSVSRASSSHGLHPPLPSGPGHPSFTKDVI